MSGAIQQAVFALGHPSLGTFWTHYQASITNDFEGIAYGVGLFVAIADSGSVNQAVSTSPDGITWTTRNSASAQWTGVAWNGTAFVSPGIFTTLGLRSLDGITWATVTLNSDGGEWGAICATATHRFVAVSQADFGFGLVLVSDDNGLSWTPKASPGSQYNGVWAGGGKVVAVGQDGSIVYSTDDGDTWTLVGSPPTGAWNSPTYGNGRWVIIGVDNSTAWSLDGIVWTQGPTLAGDLATIAFGNGLFVTPGTTNGKAYVSIDGITWRAYSCPNFDWRAICYGAGKFVAAAASGTGAVMVSE